MNDGAINLKVLFADIAVIKPGFPFRGKVPKVTGGDVLAVQMKDVDADGFVDWAGLVRTELKGRKKPDWLQPGDILVLARGNHNRAVYLEEVPVRAVCTPHFFMAQVKAEAAIMPEFLAWQINQIPAQRHFEQSAAGTIQRNIRRIDLESLPVTLPTMGVQRTVVKMARGALRERRILQDVIINRERQMLAVANKVLG